MTGKDTVFTSEPKLKPTTSRQTNRAGLVIALTLVALFITTTIRADGINWPTNQLLPSFSAPAAIIDCVDLSSASSAEIDLFSSLEGIVNRAQPRIATVSSGDGEGKFTWINLHGLQYSLINGYTAIQKYQTNLTGLVVTDPNQPDTLNVATTIAGVSNALICNPSLLATLTNAPYSLPIISDLRGLFANKYQAYGYLYSNYWSQCTHRLMAGMATNVSGNLRDYLVAMKVATVWLDPGPGNSADQATLALFLSGMTVANGVYIGWWPSEGNGLNWIAPYGIPVLASDFLRNASLYGGVSRAINIPPIPPPPPLQNKVYVSLILSDGDNIQYMQHAMKIKWNSSARGSIPIGWTVSPLAADADPAMMNFYWNTATKNDCLISGPSGAGYAHIQNWTTANATALAKLSNPYLQRSGLKVITIWDQVTSSVAQAFATNCPSLLGLTDQSGGAYTSVNHGLCTIGLAAPYTSFTNDIINLINSAAQSWNGTAPMFIGAQAVVWNLGPADLRTIANALDTNKYVMVRPDHLFMLFNRVAGSPAAVTTEATRLTANSATLQGAVIPNATNAIAWLEWGTNSGYGQKSAITNVSGTSVVVVRSAITGLNTGTNYHYRVVVSNAVGMAFGADKIFTVGGRLKAWGDSSLGQTNIPPGLTNVVSIGCGAYHGLAIKNDGSVVAWGYNAFGQTNVPAGLNNVVQVTGGMQHSLALKMDGTVVAWGGNSVDQTNVPGGLNGVVAIAAGGYHNLALKADGTVIGWGYNGFGQTNVPAGLSNVVDISAGQYHSVALKADGTIVTWGNNSFGQTNIRAGLNNLVAVGAGQYHTLALRANGLAPTNLHPASQWVADSLSGVDGSKVSNWTDSVGGKSASQNSSANQPILHANVINSHKTVRFTGANSQNLTVVATDDSISGVGSFAAVVVLKTSTGGNVSSLFYQNTGVLGAEQSGVVADWALCINGSQLGAGLGGGGNGCGTDLSLYGGNITDGNPHIVMYVRTGDIITLYVDGAIVTTQGSLCPSERGTYAFQIGAMAPGLNFFNGDIAEIQLYDRPLSSLEIMSINQSLAITYAIAGATGAVVAWGSNSDGQTNFPIDITKVAMATCGSDFNLALTSTGALTGWGNDSLGQVTALPGLTNITTLAGGLAFGLAIGNQTPLVSNATISGFVNHDLTLALPGTDPDGNSLSFYIQSLPTLGTLYQYANGAHGVPINVTNTLVSDPFGRLILAPVNNGIGTPYANFSFRAQDLFYSSGAAQITANIGLPATPQFNNAIVSSGDGDFNLNFAGSPNATYSLWASTNFTNWTKIGTAAEASAGQYQFADATSTNWPQRFYRAGAP